MKFKRILIYFATGLISLSILAVLFSFGLNIFINNRLPKIIDEKNDTEYHFQYQSIDFSIFKNTLSINGIKISPKDSIQNLDQFHIKAEIKTIGISGLDFFKLLKNKKLNAFTIHLDNTDILVFKNQFKDTLNSKPKSKLPSSINIDKILFKNVHLKVVSAIGDTLYNEIFNLNAKIDVLKMADYIQNKSLPFTYSDYEFTVDSVYTRLNQAQFIKANTIKIDPSNFDMINFRLLPLQDSKTFKKSNSKSQFEVFIPQINLKGTDWGIQNSNLYVNIKQINIDSIRFGIIDKNKLIDKTNINNSRVTKNSIIPFRLDIDELNIKKSSFNSLNTFDVHNVNINIKGISNRVNEKLHIKEFNLIKPLITQTTNKINKLRKKNEIHLHDRIEIDTLIIKEASYTLKDKAGIIDKISIQKLNLALHNIKINEETINNKIPFFYENLALNTGKIHYDTGEFYNVYSNGIILKNNSITISNFQLKPKLNKNDFNTKLKYGTDLFTVSVANIKLNKLNWGFDSNHVLFLNFDEILIDNAKANIYRNATILNKPGLNKLYSAKLREMNFGLVISKIKITNSTLVYEEETDKSTAPGVLSFKKFNANIQNIYSGYHRKKGPITSIKVNSSFMETSNVNVTWTFNIMDKSDSFNIEGKVSNLPAEAMNPFIKPYLKVSATGKIDEVNFDFIGNNKVASGIFSMNYDHLKMSIYNETGQKKRKFVSTLANLAIKKNTHGKNVENKTKPVERVENKGFFNFLWLNIKQGLKQTLL